MLQQATWNPEDMSPFYTRYVFDMSFFMIINIILMNLFFGIIIDSFADKRDKNSSIYEEVECQCFICGITKSTFEIKNQPWNQHIYEDHNMHSYLAFLIYVKQKAKSECTGVEKWVKQCLSENNIDFFPVNKCIAIPDPN